MHDATIKFHNINLALCFSIRNLYR